MHIYINMQVCRSLNARISSGVCPEVDAVFLVWPHQWRAEGNYFRQSAGSVPPNAAQDTSGCLCCKDTLLAHGQPGVYQDLWILCLQHSSTVSCQPVLVPGFIPPLWLTFVLLVQPHEAPIRPFL